MRCEGKVVNEKKIWILYFYELGKETDNSAVAQPSEERKPKLRAGSSAPCKQDDFVDILGET